MKLFRCCSCTIEKLAIPENYYPNQIERSSNPIVTSLGKCIPCAREYALQYSQKIKDRRLSRSKKTNHREGKVGTLYIIAEKNNKNNPYKIGITVGSKVFVRLTALQTSHWVDLEIYYTSPLLGGVDKVERFIHNLYSDKRVRGEWFNIDHSDIENIKSLCSVRWGKSLVEAKWGKVGGSSKSGVSGVVEAIG